MFYAHSWDKHDVCDRLHLSGRGLKVRGFRSPHKIWNYWCETLTKCTCSERPKCHLLPDMKIRCRNVANVAHCTRRGCKLDFGSQREFQHHMNPHGVGFQKIYKLKKFTEGCIFIVVHKVKSKYSADEARNIFYKFLELLPLQ